jgi:gas vesicle structural protein
MPRAIKPPRESSVADHVLEAPESSVLDLIDSLLNKGVMADGDVTLGVAGIDLIYLRLSSILCAADRVLPLAAEPPKKRRPKRRSRR